MTTPRPFQEEGIEAAAVGFGGRCLLADEMGLGKTLQALKVLERLGAFPALVVCPAAVKLHWQREAWKHCRLRATVLFGKWASGTRGITGRPLYVANYEILRGWMSFLLRQGFKGVVCDECQAICNMNTRRFRAVRRVTRGVPTLLMLSGTPLVNRPFELFPALNLLRPDVWGDPFFFGQEYCDAEHSFGSWKFSGASNLGRLHEELIEHVMVRRLKVDVLDQLPPIRYSVVPMKIENREEYEHAELDLIGWLAGYDIAAAQRAKRAERFVRFTYLKKLAAELKLPAVIAWLEKFLAKSDGKMLVGTIHHAFRRALLERFKSLSTTIHGGMTAHQRQEAEDKFRKSKGCRFLFGQIKACGFGLNLPEASDAAIAEFPWTPGAVSQFFARVHRLTSTEGVRARYLTAKGTVEEHLCKVIQKKSKNLGAVLDGKRSGGHVLSVFDLLQEALTTQGGR